MHAVNGVELINLDKRRKVAVVLEQLLLKQRGPPAQVPLVAYLRDEREPGNWIGVLTGSTVPHAIVTHGPIRAAADHR